MCNSLVERAYLNRSIKIQFKTFKRIKPEHIKQQYITKNEYKNKLSLNHQILNSESSTSFRFPHRMSKPSKPPYFYASHLNLQCDRQITPTISFNSTHLSAYEQEKWWKISIQIIGLGLNQPLVHFMGADGRTILIPHTLPRRNIGLQFIMSWRGRTHVYNNWDISILSENTWQFAWLLLFRRLPFFIQLCSHNQPLEYNPYITSNCSW